MTRQAEPLQPLEINGGEENHLQPEEDPMLVEGLILKKSVTLRGIYAGAFNRWDAYSPWKELTLVRQVHGGLSCGRDVTLLQGSAMRNFTPEE